MMRVKGGVTLVEVLIGGALLGGIVALSATLNLQARRGDEPQRAVERARLFREVLQWIRRDAREARGIRLPGPGRTSRALELVGPRSEKVLYVFETAESGEEGRLVRVSQPAQADAARPSIQKSWPHVKGSFSCLTPTLLAVILERFHQEGGEEGRSARPLVAYVGLEGVLR